MPAEIDLPAFIYVNLWFFTLRGIELFVYCPNPSSPFLPEPHTQTSPYLDLSEHTPMGIMNAATKVEAFQNLPKFIKNNLDLYLTFLIFNLLIIYYF